MPSSAARTCTNRILRDYLKAALRCSAHPLTTTQLRRAAPLVAVAGSARPLPPPQEAIYRLLRSLEAEGAVSIVDTPTAARYWTAAADPDADREIAALEALLSAPSAQVAHHERIRR
ncbi:MAG: hypothetical protein K0U84_19005 [Actinomycetia bacterium]|nr:hypothetical protein [Actinomycetes bacterium]